MTRADLAKIALSQVGTWCYVWGGNGEDMTAMTDEKRESWIVRRESDDKNRERVRKLYAELVKKGVALIRGGDCSGFVFWCMRELGVWKTDMNANGMYHKTDRIERAELVPGDLAFRLTDDRATHVGVYTGDGMFVHSKGRDVGVVKEASKSSYWQAYGRIKELDDDPKPDPGPDPDPPGPSPTGYRVRIVGGNVKMRSQPMIGDNYVCTAKDGMTFPYIATAVAADGKEWYAVECSRGKDGILFVSAFTGKDHKYTVLEEVK